MSFFDFFFPEQAQASHLRSLAEQGQHQANTLHRQHMQDAQQRRRETAITHSQEQRIAQLEKEIGEAGLMIGALLELLEQSGTVTREALAARTKEIDGRDGTVDGKISQPEPAAFMPNRQWPGNS